jgi:hypothetical protein
MNEVIVPLDADAPLDSFSRIFGVIVERKTGVFYQHQCGCYACLQLQTEGFFVPQDQFKYDFEQGVVRLEDLTKILHLKHRDEISIDELRERVGELAYWA